MSQLHRDPVRAQRKLVPYVPPEEAVIQAKLLSMKMPASIQYAWEGTTLVVTDTEYNTVTRWRFEYKYKQLAHKQIDLALENGRSVPVQEWNRSGLWRRHAEALTVLTHQHRDEVLAHLNQ